MESRCSWLPLVLTTKGYSDKSYDNVVAIDIDAQRTYLESRGMDTSEMDDIAVAKANTGTKVFIASNVKFVNAMEDLKMNVNM